MEELTGRLSWGSAGNRTQPSPREQLVGAEASTGVRMAAGIGASRQRRDRA